MSKHPKMEQNQRQQSSITSTPRRALQELSTNICYSSSPDLPRGIDFISFEDYPEPSLSLGLDISFMSDEEPQVEDCSCENSSALEHSEYRRLANAEGRDSRLFDDEYIIPPPLGDDYTAIQLNQHRRKDHVGPWQMGETLGSGATGRVRLCRHQSDHRLGAVKIMSKQRVEETEMADDLGKPKQKWANSMEREVIIMKMVRHPNVVRMYDVWEGSHELYLVLEYVDRGDLFDYMIKHGSLPEPVAMGIFVQILKGVEYCHHFNICHRDLKLENILLDQNNRVKVADFGFAALQPPGWKLARSCGTPHYAAPEVIAGGEYNGPPADIWSCGVILFALLNGHVPFDDDDPMMILEKVKIGKYIMPMDMSPEAQDLVHRILNVNPEKRITLKEIWKHPLLTLYLDGEDFATRKRQSSFRTVARPVECAEEIDRTILESMGSLWPYAKDLEMIKAALLSSEPNQEKVFYALLERYKDDTAEYFDGKLVSQQNASKRLLSNKSGKLLRSNTGSTRSGAQSRASNKRAESGKYISPQRLHQIQESEEGQGACVNAAERGISGDEDWQDYYHCGVKDNPEVKYKSSTMTEDHHVFHEDDEGVLDFKTSEPEDNAPSLKEPPSQRDQLKAQRRKSRPKSWASAAPHRRSVVFNHKGSSRADRFDIEQIAESLHKNILPSRASTPDSSPERILMGRKEGVKARRKKRSSIGSSYSGAVTGIATVIPVRRRAIMRTDGGDVRRRSILPMEDEDVRKVSREFSDICEAAFKTGSTILPRTLPSSAVFSETVMDLEFSQLTLVPDNNTPTITQRSLHKDEELPSTHQYTDSDFNVPVRALERVSDLDTVIADLDEQIKRYGSEAVNKPHLVKHKRRAVSGTMQRAGSEREERRTASEPTRPTQGQNRGHRAVAPNPRFDNGASITNTRNFSVRTESGVLDLPYISPRGRPLGKGVKSRGNRPESTYSDTDRENHRTNCSGSLYVERHRQEVARLRGSDHGYSPTEENHIDGNDVRDINIPKKRTIFSKLFDTKFGTARAPEVRSSKVKTSGFWSTIGSKIGAHASKSTQECQPVCGNKFFRLWNREYRKEIGNARPVPPLLDCQVSDEEDVILEPVQYVKPEWFRRALNLKPASFILCFKPCALVTHRKILDILEEWQWKDLGVRDIKANKHQGLITARVSRRNAINTRPVSFIIQVRSYRGSATTGKSVVRILQQKGAASSLRRLTHEITKVCRRGGIMIDDALEIMDMERTFDSLVA